MNEAQKKVREYLAEIGKRGGLASRRELTKSHARQSRPVNPGRLATANRSSSPENWCFNYLS